MNGWKNRETWLVNLWFGDSFAMMQDDGDDVTADYIENLVSDYIDHNLDPKKCHGFIMDMMDLSAIDYEELAAHYGSETAEAD
jgi:hypothetical protein